MTIFFLMTDLQQIKYYYETLRFLLKRRHRIHLAFFNPREPQKEKGYLTKLATEFPETFSVGEAPRKRSDIWDALCVACAWGMDYLLYFHAIMREAHRLRHRIEMRIHPAFVWLMSKCPLASSPSGHRFIGRLLHCVYGAIPVSSSIRKYCAGFEPDVFLVTPLVFHGSLQSEYLRASHWLGVPSAYCVASWDNLTTKGVIRGNPDKIMVWNEIQRDEAVTLHAVASEKVVVTGSQYFDDWFIQSPSRTKEDFCRVVGLRPDRPILLYLCSSNFMAPNERKFVLRWISAIRAAKDNALAEAGILIRPYPKSVEQWTSIDLSPYGNVVVWPAAGEYTTSDAGKKNFYDSVYHSVAVVGINTTAMIESAIIGRCVLSILAPELNDSQSNTVHFNYLRQENGGFLYLARDLGEHTEHLQEILDSPKEMAEKVSRFVTTFVRPHGIDSPCVPILSQSVEDLVHIQLREKRLSLGKMISHLLILPVALSLFIWRLLTHSKRRDGKMERKKLLDEAQKKGHDPLLYIEEKG
jgi:hypothetical protein